MQATERVDVASAALFLVAEAESQGLVLTIEQRPLEPLRMGHYSTVVSIRPARPAAAVVEPEQWTEDPDHG